MVTRAIDGDFSDLKTRQITTYLTSSGAVGIKTPFGKVFTIWVGQKLFVTNL